MTPGSLPHRDVVVGGGVAGLAAVSRLSEHDVLLLEESDRLGGRMASLTGPDESFVNLGAHLLTGGRSSIAELGATSGMTTIPVPGIKSALWFGGALYMHRRAALYPFMLPLSMRERWALVRTGARIRLLAEAWRRAWRPRSGGSAALYRRRLARFRSERTFTELLDGLPLRVVAVFATAARRSSGEADELTVGAAVSIFGALWVGAGSESVRNVSGGAGLLGEHWRRALGDRAMLRARVTEVHEDGDQVLVTYVVAGQEQRIAARHVIVAVPAPVASRILLAAPAEAGTGCAVRATARSCAWASSRATPARSAGTTSTPSPPPGSPSTCCSAIPAPSAPPTLTRRVARASCATPAAPMRVRCWSCPRPRRRSASSPTSSRSCPRCGGRSTASWCGTGPRATACRRRRAT